MDLTRPFSFIRPFSFADDDTECECCHYQLGCPYIMCGVCDIYLCTTCFASGVEFGDHINSHSFAVLDNNFQLFRGSGWTAQEELILLNVLAGCGNFHTAARYLPQKNLDEIKEHYNYFYLEGNGSNLFPTFSKTPPVMDNEVIRPYRFNLRESYDPPRYIPNVFGFRALAGYNAARSDFEMEFDSSAEDLISSLKFKAVHRNDPDYEVISNLQCAIINSYNRRLFERQRRRAIIRNHGIILLRKVIGWLHRYDMTITRKVYDRLCRFMQFYTGEQFEYLLEGLHQVGLLKTKISRLCEVHKKKITTLKSAELYRHLRQLHESSLTNVRSFQNNNQFNWKVKHSLVTAFCLPAYARRRSEFTPLDVVGLPGCEKLTSKEQDLCRKARLVPLSFIEFRDILVSENSKSGYLKLQTARRLLKIDVNKTRRLYDFLFEEGYINKQ